ncbi:hypothetical protein NKH77_09670 [Streptomyces sp. M19]
MAEHPGAHHVLVAGGSGITRCCPWRRRRCARTHVPGLAGVRQPDVDVGAARGRTDRP